MHEKLVDMVRKMKSNAVILQYMERDFGVVWRQNRVKYHCKFKKKQHFIDIYFIYIWSFSTGKDFIKQMLKIVIFS